MTNLVHCFLMFLREEWPSFVETLNGSGFESAENVVHATVIVESHAFCTNFDPMFDSGRTPFNIRLFVHNTICHPSSHDGRQSTESFDIDRRGFSFIGSEFLTN